MDIKQRDGYQMAIGGAAISHLNSFIYRLHGADNRINDDAPLKGLNHLSSPKIILALILIIWVVFIYQLLRWRKPDGEKQLRANHRQR
ncbi:hypothetical protein [Acinetobacter larvae]|uniref:Uncharacterized protein n=1 Tax=Acinetobacter larvae TaxID=1789224 RepID=A0A1B2M2U9_9GAMM|nr:hypothetical protein [Acinetobacter larvae]AOA59353.2 hypothetical protein BFG52_13970 [Acinetobacter larvae]